MKKNRKPVRFTGQHFTIDHILITDAINFIDIRKHDTVLDIGAGKGFITTHLLARCNKIYAIENDQTLANFLKQKFGDNKCVEIIYRDFRNFNVPKVNFKVVANIPYCLTSKVLKYLMYVNMEYFAGASLIMQFEPAYKLTSKGGSDPLKLFYRTFYDFQIICEIAPHSFAPPPTVKSALLGIIKKKNCSIGIEMKERYFRYLYFIFRNPSTNVLTVLKTIFRKSQARRIIKKLYLQKNSKISELSADKIAACFQQMILVVPDRFQP
ncbi:hypothetical protein H8B06_12095 [Sphingobacterium sp. DN00404]|uniref:Ribosomal RNA adenine methylase transferase N-terminal domain-containing protein n=1 Tax=Sphingobacterium micropteri TaxID=2763501 RepID=A0ABR7YQK2_9SPHI|nr:rRNA adenine N-6-methyltransferase family protein [Sphingobacterium micropteri]MBD1433572.1 hypothetical protein [Sphingobacterium micropteri]